jgi:hypothetical protein
MFTLAAVHESRKILLPIQRHTRTDKMRILRRLEYKDYLS